MPSGIDLLSETKTGVDLLSLPSNIKSGIDLLSQPVVELDEVLESKPVGPTREFYKSVSDKMLSGIDPGFESAESKSKMGEIAMDMLSGFEEQAGQITSLGRKPFEVVKGAVDFGLSIPGFTTGIFNAIGKIGKEVVDQIAFIGSESKPEFSLERMYNLASEGMAESMQYFEQTKGLFTGKPTAESQLVGEIVMSPLTALSSAGHAIAGWKGFEEYPNIRGAIKFTGDIVGLITMGMLLHGRGGKVETVKKLEDVTKEAKEIVKKEQMIEEIPEGILKSAQESILKVEKQQLELRAKEAADSISKDALIREELLRQAEGVAREKTFEKSKKEFDKKVVKEEKARQKVVEKDLKVDEVIPEPIMSESLKPIYQEVIDTISPDVRKDISVESIEIIKFPPLYEGEGGRVEIFGKLKEPEKYRIFIEKGEPVKETLRHELLHIYGLKHPEKVGKGYFDHEGFVDKLDKDIPKPITEVDQLTGTEVPGLKGEKSPFFQDKETADIFGEIYSERAKAISESIETFTQKHLNDVNRWYHGDESVDIVKTREFLSRLAAEAGEFRRDFLTGEDHLMWKETVEEGAKWARELDRQPIFETFYHGTSAKEFAEFKGDIVYLTSDPKETIFFAEGVLGEKKGGKPRTISVKVPKGKTKNIDEIVQDTIMASEDLDIVMSKQAKIARKEGYEYLEFEHPGEEGYFISKVALYPDRLIIERTGSAEAKLYSGLPVDKILSEGKKIIDKLVKSKLLTPENIAKEFDIAFDGIQETIKDGDLFAFTEPNTHGSFYIKDLKDIPAKLDNIAEKFGRKEGKGVKLYAGIPIDKLGNVVELISKPTKEFHKKLKSDIQERVDRALEKIINYNKWEWSEGNKVRSNKTNKVWTVKSKAWDSKNDAPIYFLESSGESGSFNAVKAHEKFTLLSGPQTLYTGIPIDPKLIISGARKVAEYTKKARGMKSFKPLAAAKAIRKEFTRDFVDRSGNIRLDLLNKLGNKGYEVVQKMYLSKGANAKAANMLNQMNKEVYAGLNKNERRILDDVILDDRMLDIAKYKSEKKFKFPVDPVEHAKHRELFRYKKVNTYEELSTERAALIDSRTKAYYEWMKKPLKDMLDVELISEQEYIDLVSHNYRRLKLVDIYDKKQSGVGKRARTVYDSGVEALSKGRDTDIFEPSSEIMALEVFNRAYGRIRNNEANKALYDVARIDNKNPFVRIKEKKGDKIPSGWNQIFMYEKGERKSMYLSPEMSKEWITASPEISAKAAKLIRYLTLSPVLRTFATGINWGFAIANLPRDVMHTWYAARTFKDGEWSGVYSPHLPMFNLQIGKDLATVFTDAATKGPRYQGYIDRGGGMEFLVHQGRMFQKGRHVEGVIDKIYNFFGYFGETSEIMTRLAIENRVVKNRAKEQGISIEQAWKNEDITREATFAARDYMDFGQGGSIAKVADNGMPYLNAAIQGTRGLFRSFKPGSGTAFSSTYKLAQFATAVVGLYIAMRKMHPKTTKDLQGNIDMKNNIVIPLGDNFAFEDERGQTRYPYLKIPLDPGQKFFKTFFEAATDKWLGYDVDVNRVIDSLKEFSPVGVTELPPSISGVLGYATNKNFWMNEDIWRKTKPFDYPESKEEFIPGVTPEVFVDIGKFIGLSPERTRYVVEEITTSGTLWSYLLGRGYEELFSDLPKRQREQHLAMVLAQMPVVKRFFGVTNPYSKHVAKLDELDQEVVIKDFVRTRELDRLIDGYLYADSVEQKEIFKFIKEFKDVEIRNSMMDEYRYQTAIKDLPERSFWMRLRSMRIEVRAKAFADRLEKSNVEERKQMWKEYGIIFRAGGTVTKSFISEFMKTYGQE